MNFHLFPHGIAAVSLIPGGIACATRGRSAFDGNATVLGAPGDAVTTEAGAENHGDSILGIGNFGS